MWDNPRRFWGMRGLARGVLAAWMLCWTAVGPMCWGQGSPRGSATKGRSAREQLKNRLEAEHRGSTEESLVASFWQQYDTVVRHLERSGTQPPQVIVPQGVIAAQVDLAHLGVFYSEQGASRYLALHLWFGNRSSQHVQLRREELRVFLDEMLEPIEPLEGKLLNHGFPLGGEYYPLELLKTPAVIDLPAQGVSGCWLVIPDVGAGNNLPECRLEWPLSTGAVLQLPVSRWQFATLGQEVQRLDPKGRVALLTLSGTFNTFNVFVWTAELERLVQLGCNRVVVQWRETASAPEGQLVHWLSMIVQPGAVLRVRQDQFPVLPAGLKELHLVKPTWGISLPSGDADRLGWSRRLHERPADALAAALRSLTQRLRREELLELLAHAPPLSRAALLHTAASRLQSADIPWLMSWIQDPDPELSRAAVLALADIDDERGWQQLEMMARSESSQPILWETAMRAMSTSRFPTLRERFLEIWRHSSAERQRQIALLVAADPQPEWADFFYRFVHDASGELQPALVQALVDLDHPDLLSLLSADLKGTHERSRQLAFQYLSQRSEPEAQALALEYVLEQLRQPAQPFDAAWNQFLMRSRDARVVPILLERLEHGQGDQAALLNLLGYLGDQRIADIIVRKFAQWKPHEQGAALLALRQVRDPQFVVLARQVLQQEKESLVHQAVDGLLYLGSEEVEDLLCETFQSSSRPAVLTGVARGLALLGTERARRTLRESRRDPLAARQQAAITGLQLLRQSSPATRFLDQGLQHVQAEEWPEAQKAFQTATILDPLAPEAWISYGDVLYKQDQWAEAEQAFMTAYRLDPEHGLAVTGLAITRLMQGQLQPALELLESHRERLKDDVNFLYNAACVYGRAVEKMREMPASPERDARLQLYQQRAISDLRRARELKYNDLAWMKRDPDLKSLHDLPEFQQLVHEGSTSPQPPPAQPSP
ncbi:MAG: hypothetical protein KatS3mg113_1110 [Planctomycetaceae bacterium]|nr:MAG: hypothetical protein KatS3mg113_1110 [Planctomycetaceae bacterium]